MCKPPNKAMTEAALRIFAPKTKERPSAWCARELRLPPPFNKNGDKIDYALSPFLPEMIDQIGELYVTDLAACIGSQGGKTTWMTAMRAWRMVHRPCAWGIMWPNTNKVMEYSNTRWRPMCEISPALNAIRKKGKVEWKALEQHFSGGIVLMFGSGSPANIASTPLTVVEMDELDKVSGETDTEANSAELFASRVKRSDDALRIRASTPSVAEGFIWKHFCEGDQRRYFIPCPHCSKDITLVFDKESTQLTLIGNESSVVIPPECRENNVWNLDRVRAETYIECCHCKGKIYDSQKTKMNRLGKWVATNPTAPRGKVSFHLSSLYVPGRATSWGQIAVDFLEGKRNGSLHDVVNNMLAEPYVSQDGEVSARKCAEITPELPAGWWVQLAVDVQKDHEWAVVARFDITGNCQVLHAQKTHGIGEIRELQERFGVADHHVVMDSGFDTSRVYQECLRFGRTVPLPGRPLPLHIGWTPIKGTPKAYFLNPETKGRSLYRVIHIDPFIGDHDARQGRMQIPLLEAASDGFKDEIMELRHGRKEVSFDVSSSVDQAEFWRHMDGERRQPRWTGKTTVMEWIPKSKSWPNHYLDCIVYHYALHRWQVDLHGFRAQQPQKPQVAKQPVRVMR